MKNCIVCQKEIVFENHRQKKRVICSQECAKKNHIRLYGMSSNFPGIATGTVGAIGELVASVDLMSRGYDVFRALSQSCSCDLLALKDGNLLRIEVRTGYRGASGKLQYSKSDNDSGRSDHFAIVLGGKEVIYLPELV